MIDFILDLFNSLYSLLPDSFIQSTNFISSEDMELISNYINYLNWFIPFDIASKIMSVWLVCVLSYYIGGIVKSVVEKLIATFLTDS